MQGNKRGFNDDDNEGGFRGGMNKRGRGGPKDMRGGFRGRGGGRGGGDHIRKKWDQGKKK